MNVGDKVRVPVCSINPLDSESCIIEYVNAEVIDIRDGFVFFKTEDCEGSACCPEKDIIDGSISMLQKKMKSLITSIKTLFLPKNTRKKGAKNSSILISLSDRYKENLLTGTSMVKVDEQFDILLLVVGLSVVCNHIKQGIEIYIRIFWKNDGELEDVTKEFTGYKAITEHNVGKICLKQLSSASKRYFK